MTASAQQFPYMARDPSLGNASLVPMLPMTLIGRQSLGFQLGFDWEQQTRSVELSGNLAATEARVVVLSAVIGGFPRVRLAFAWAQTDAVSVILGQVNFFMEFDVCFFRSRDLFEVRPKP